MILANSIGPGWHLPLCLAVGLATGSLASGQGAPGPDDQTTRHDPRTLPVRPPTALSTAGIGYRWAPRGSPAGPRDGLSPAGRSLVERYHLNAQYRGGVKKGFPEIGTGTARFTPRGAGLFTVQLNGTVEHPENHDTYQFWLDMDFQVRGQSVRVTRNGSRYNQRAVEYREQVERIVPFVYLVKYTPTPGPGQDPSRSYRYRGDEYALRYVPTERHVEASLYDGDSLVGKFFLFRDQGGVPLVFEKFRVPTQGNIVLSFVRD